MDLKEQSMNVSSFISDETRRWFPVLLMVVQNFKQLIILPLW